jgi:glutamyl endopeptidase
VKGVQDKGDTLMHFLMTGLAAVAASGLAFVSGVALSAPHDTISDDGQVTRGVASAEFGPAQIVKSNPGKKAVDLSDPATVDELAYELFLNGVDDAGLELIVPERKTTALAKYAGQESVIGVDRRRRVYTSTFPERATVYITYNGGRWCSGSMIGPSAVATAGHCLERGASGGWYTTSLFRVYPGSDGTSRPYGSCTAKQLITTLGWANSSNEEYDYGAIILNCTVGNTVGYYGWTTESPVNKPATVQGYPSDKDPAGSQWQSNDKIGAASTRQVFYKADTFNAMSGSPVWYDKSGSLLNGIHAYGVHGSGNHRNYNHGVRITSDVSSNLLTWRNTR